MNSPPYELGYDRLPPGPELYIFRSTLVRWARRKGWLSPGELRIGPYTIDEAHAVAETGQLSDFADAMDQIPALPSLEPWCGEHSRIVTLTRSSDVEAKFSAEGPLTAAQRVLSLQEAVAAIVRVRHFDERDRFVSHPSAHEPVPPDWRYSFSSMMRINIVFFYEVTRYVWSTVTDVNNLTGLLWQFERCTWRTLPSSWQYNYLSGRFPPLGIDAFRSANHFHFYGRLVTALHVGVGELRSPILACLVQRLSNTPCTSPFSQVRELHWSIAMPRNRASNLDAFKSSPLQVLVFDIQYAPEDSVSYRYFDNLLRRAGSTLRHLREVSFTRRSGTQSVIAVPAPVLRHLGSLSSLALHADIKDLPASPGSSLLPGPQELDLTWTLRTDVQAIVDNLDTTRLLRLRMRLEGPAREERLRDVRTLVHVLASSLVHIELSTSFLVSTCGSGQRFQAAFAPLLRCSLLEHVKVKLPDMSFRFDIRSLNTLFLSWPKIHTLHLSFQPAETGAGIDIRHVFDVVGQRLVSLHLPSLHTAVEHGAEFALPPVQTVLAELSSDNLFLGHCIVDVVWGLSVAKIEQGAVEWDHLFADWKHIYTLLDHVKARDLYAQAHWLRTNASIVLRHLSSAMLHGYLDVARFWPKQFVVEEVWGMVL